MTEPTALELLEELCTVEARIAALIGHGQAVRSQLQEKAVEAYRREGVAPTWRAANLGTLTLPINRPRTRVAQPEVFASWAAQRWTDHVQGTITLACSPSQMVEIVEALNVFAEDLDWPQPRASLTVDPAWLSGFLDDVVVVEDQDGTHYFAPETGETVEGLSYNPGGPGSVSVRLNAEAKKRAAAEAGLAGDVLLAPLPEGVTA